MGGLHLGTVTVVAVALLMAACVGDLDSTIEPEALRSDAGTAGTGGESRDGDGDEGVVDAGSPIGENDVGMAGGETDGGPGSTTDGGHGGAADGGGTDAGAGGGHDAGTDSGASGEDAGTRPLAPEVDPGCIDGLYTEILPDPSVDVSAEVSSYQSSQAGSFAEAMLQKRYPIGAWLIAQGNTATNINCLESFVGTPATAYDAVRKFSTLVHECGHLYDHSLAGFTDHAYAISSALTLICSGGDTVARNGETFARSRITQDAYASLRPACSSPFSMTGGCDSYAPIYLNGNPDDSTFDSGDQGFNLLLEEAHQYVNSLAIGYAFQDFISGSRSYMDGMLTFLWYVERYLRMARLDYPQAYQKLTGDPCWREAILTIWGRAWLFLAVSEGNGALGIHDQELFDLVRAPELLDEIQRIREAEGCSVVGGGGG